MDAKLDSYRARKRRQATVASIKSTLLSMIPFHPQQQTPSEHRVTVEEDQVAPVAKTELKKSKPSTLTPPDQLSDDDTVLPFTDSDSDADATAAAAAAAAKQKTGATSVDYLTYLTWLAYFLLWVTCYAIAIELQFGLVYLLISAIAGIYLNTRTGPRRRHEVSAYSVFNRDCVAIDGTLNAEQFEREIRYGPAGVR